MFRRSLAAPRLRAGRDGPIRRVKNVRDAADLADLPWIGRLREAWLTPPAVRELRDRAKLVALRTALKAHVHGRGGQDRRRLGADAATPASRAG